jgi:sugar lactone lactonase YvrE
MLAKKLQQVVGNAGEDVSWDLDYAYYTGPDAWDISTADFIGTEYVGGQETFPRALYIKPDGTGFYVTGSAGDDVNQYSVSVPWRLLISSYVRKFSISAQETSPGGIFFKPDGTVMYVSGSSGDDINQYSLSPCLLLGMYPLPVMFRTFHYPLKTRLLKVCFLSQTV